MTCQEFQQRGIPCICTHTGVICNLVECKLYKGIYMHLDDLFCSYQYFQSPHSSSWKDPALSKVNRFCRESRCMDQWVPIINLPERWTLSCKNLWRDSYLHRKSGVNPDGHIATQRSNSKALLKRKILEEKKTPRYLHGVYLKEKIKCRGMDFHAGQDCLELRLSALAT